MSDIPFWKQKSLFELSLDEWESLCDGCGKCCLHKLEDEDTDEIFYTNVACALLDIGTCRCTNYVERTFRVPDCVELTAKNLMSLKWLPPTCAYRLIHEGKDLAWWHPLVSGDPDTVHRANVSVQGRGVLKNQAGELEDHIVTWPEET
ncbi:MAG: YcgN family cysteine cluster protein, partial [Rhodospirillales bacterium]|nr:YcgN family cysteine cluster protein [Rhodospirillales bacterium]